MLKLTELAPPGMEATETLTLPFEARQKSRQPATTDAGTAVGVFLLRGQILRAGMVLTGPDAVAVRIEAAPEAVSVALCNDALQFARACYHLGNRHVPLQILSAELRYLNDHVLDHMLEGLGLTVEHTRLPFEPEAGAYHGHAH